MNKSDFDVPTILPEIWSDGQIITDAFQFTSDTQLIASHRRQFGVANGIQYVGFNGSYNSKYAAQGYYSFLMHDMDAANEVITVKAYNGYTYPYILAVWMKGEPSDKENRFLPTSNYLGYSSLPENCGIKWIVNRATGNVGTKIPIGYTVGDVTYDWLVLESLYSDNTWTSCNVFHRGTGFIGIYDPSQGTGPVGSEMFALRKTLWGKAPYV